MFPEWVEVSVLHLEAPSWSHSQDSPSLRPFSGVVPGPLGGESWRGPGSRMGRSPGDPTADGVWVRTSASSFTRGRSDEASVLEAS